jgi:molybdopterin synthase sulfur carrier subunit
MKLEIKYFAWVKTKIGKPGESLELPATEITIAGLVQHLKGVSGGHANAFENPNTVQFAVNMEFADETTVLQDGDEVGFFPPVTGGGA